MKPTSTIRELRPEAPPGGEVVCTSLSTDGKLLAFAAVGGAEPGIYACRTDALQDRRRIVEGRGWTPVELTWAPGNGYLAYRTVPSSERVDEVAWADVKGKDKKELGRIEARGFAWLPSGKTLMVSDPDEEQLQRIEVATNKTVAVSDQRFDTSAYHFPAIAPSPDGKRIAFTGRSVDEDSSRVWWLVRKDKELTVELLTWIPGADVHVRPFWSPKGVSIALWLVHVARNRTGLVVVRRLEGQGEILYEHRDLDAAVAPAWSPDGSRIALYRSAGGARSGNGSADYELVLVHAHDKTIDVLCEPGRTFGAPHYVDATHLAVDGTDAAYLIEIHGAT